MDRFTPHYQGKPWVDGAEVIHAYVLPQAGVDDELLALAHACRPALLDYPVDPACPWPAGDPGTLHMTIEMVADARTADISSDERQALVDGLHKELADVAPFETEVGPPIAGGAGAVLDVWPEDQAVALQNRVRTAIRTARGNAALQHTGGRLHVSVGYSYDTANSDRLNSALRALTPRRAPLHVNIPSTCPMSVTTSRPIPAAGVCPGSPSLKSRSEADPTPWPELITGHHGASVGTHRGPQVVTSICRQSRPVRSGPVQQLGHRQTMSDEEP
ncbi:2'-5' RNA ligase family protein [Streptomyces platensis]|uniref:2'-5' RNA ligase family protein n=1 Tax=Streptomyces platensis TaxID=58346 RepID=UPI0030DF384A